MESVAAVPAAEIVAGSWQAGALAETLEQIIIGNRQIESAGFVHLGFHPSFTQRDRPGRQRVEDFPRRGAGFGRKNGEGDRN